MSLAAEQLLGGASAITWLLGPWSGAEDHHIAAWAAWHGRAMVLAWSILAPVGVLLARYFKVWPGQDWPRVLDDKHWWHAHRGLQILALIVATAGVWLAWRNAAGGTALARWHGRLGWAVMALGWLQVLGGMLRGTKGGPTDPRAVDLAGDHYLMTPRRNLFEYLHKIGGYVALALALAVVPLGLAVADAPRWMWLVIGGWWLALAATVVRLQKSGRCVDTYQAIWGPDPSLPGNRLRPIGWGVCRPLDVPSERGPHA